MSSAKNIETCIQCHGSSAGEVWECALSRDGVRLAFITGLESHAAAKQAAEYLRFGFAGDWATVPSVSGAMIEVGIESMKKDRWAADEFEDMDKEAVHAIWASMINVWTAEMLDRANNGDKP
jgi:hypothetical protein